MTSITGPGLSVSHPITSHFSPPSISPSLKLPELVPLSSIPRSAEPAGVEYLQQQGLTEYRISAAPSMTEYSDPDSKFNLDFVDQPLAHLSHDVNCEAETDQYV
jgi:hypothetical protein